MGARIAAGCLVLALQAVTLTAHAAGVEMLRTRTAAPGDTLSVIVAVGDAGEFGVASVESLDVDVTFDADALEFVSVVAGSAFAAAASAPIVLPNEPAAGVLRVGLATLGPVAIGNGVGLLEFEFRVLPGASPATDLSPDGVQVRVNEFEATFDVAGPGVADGDGDGINDVEEVRNGLDPTDADDGSLDPDMDGVSSRDELLAGSDPDDPDSVPGAPYLARDAAGAWDAYIWSDDASGANAPYAEHCAFTFDSDGVSASGACEGVDGSGETIPPGDLTLFLGDIGEVTLGGPFIGAPTFADAHMDIGRTAIAGMEASAVAGVAGEQALLLLIERGTGYRQADLDGTWHLFQAGDNAAPDDDGSFWARYVLRFAGGSLLPGSALYEDGAPATAVPLTAAGATLSADGEVMATGELSASASVLLERMDAGRSVIVGVARESFDGGTDIEDSLRVWLKQGDAYSQDDATGVWFAYLLNDAAGEQSPLVAKLTLVVDAAGTVLMDGSNAEGEAFSLPGTLAVSDAEGQKGLVTLGGELGGLFSYQHLRLDAGATVMAGVLDEDDAGQRRPGLLVAVKSVVSAPRLVSPAPGSVLDDTVARFAWTTNGTPVTGWQLMVGTGKGLGNLHDTGLVDGALRARAVSGLPNDGSTLHVRLWYLSGTWQSVDVTYTAYTGAVSLPALTRPAPGSKLGATSAQFAWATNGTSVTNWRLWVGSTSGAFDLHDSGVVGGGVLSANVAGLPNDGRDLYVRLWYREASTWKFVEAGVEAAGLRPALTSHADWSVLTGASETFQWNANGVMADGWALWFGATSGGRQYGFALTQNGADDTLVFANLPYAGETVHVTLWWRVNGVWSAINSRRYTFTALTAAMPALTGPDGDGGGIGAMEPFAGTGATFTWDDGGTPVEDHAIWFGSTPGGLQYGYAWASEVSPGAPASVTELAFTRLPYQGEEVHVTFYWKVRGVWRSRAYTFEAVSLPDPELVGPDGDGGGIGAEEPLSGTTATFSWDDNGVAVEDHAIWFGSTPGGVQYGYVWARSASDAPLEFTDLPYAGERVYATFYWKVRGVWRTTAYTFRAADLRPVLTAPEDAGDGDAVIDPATPEQLPGPVATFGWNDNGLAVDDHAVWFGTTPGGQQYGYVWARSASDAPLEFTNLPYRGERVHATLWYQVKGVWHSRPYLFQAVNRPPELTSHGEGSELAGSSATFAWDDHAVVVEDHAIWFGTTIGGRQHGFVWARSPADDPLPFTNLPTDGSTVHVTFYWRVNGVWNSHAYQMEAASSAP